MKTVLNSIILQSFTDLKMFATIWKFFLENSISFYIVFSNILVLDAMQLAINSAMWKEITCHHY